ncbi:AAA-ATPase At3g50940-like [Quercus lobata]|uniref:AAA+ ATPase domain-containing protein n=1 Tax=Quercus lobata TaxID=97700 RepID=A0A7N2MVT5_QUELO|nr:AAA-ATPase At3g50940-like [Quercus lobata]
MFPLLEVLKSLAQLSLAQLSLAQLFTATVIIVLSPILTDRIAAVRSILFSNYQDYFFPQLTMIIEESDGFSQNQLYAAARTYVGVLFSVSRKPRHFKCRRAIKGEKLVFDFVGEDFYQKKDIAREDSIIANFEGIKLEWKSRAKINEHNGETVSKYFELSFDKRHEKKVLEYYIPHLLARAEEIRKEERVPRLYSRGGSGLGEWLSINFEHPTTFEKLAMDPTLKRMLKDDLDRFVKRKDWYKKVGRAWKRGYLIYGPPGTGKSTLIAAMANFLKFDIYDVDISSINSDLDLRKILLSTSNGSIMVMEDIDCARLEKGGQQNKASSAKFTLSGLLNVIDGLWSNCGDERIIVFTTNHKDKLDPALFRRGRMDVHVHMSYCTIDGFKLLATNYLKIEDDHQLYRQIEVLLANVEVTPAEIAEELLNSSGSSDDVVLARLVEFFEQKLHVKAKAAELKERLKSADIDVDAEGLVKFLKQKKLENAKEKEVEQLLNSGDTDIDAEGFVKFIKQKKIEDAKAAEAK